MTTRALPLLILLAACSAACSAANVHAAMDWADAAPREQILRDWLYQDHGPDVAACFADGQGHAAERKLVERVLREVGGADAVRRELQVLVTAGAPGRDPRWKALYIGACEARRANRLAGLPRPLPEIIFARHYNLGGSHYAYTEGQSDAQHERHFIPGTALCLMRMEGVYGHAIPLIEDAGGVIRDPDVDFDGEHVLFSWKKSDREDDYHLYELNMATGKLRQITAGLGFADYEGVYLPNGEVMFNSTRCVQIVDCWWTEVSNLYVVARDGRFLRRVGYDQVHTNYPQVLSDGRVVYTRWDYNDRGQLFPQPLFQMNPDGTGQTEYYGNNSWFPTTLIHARSLPGDERLIAIATGHHSDQGGKLVIVDRARGRQENEGIQLIAPVRETPAARIDAYGQEGDQSAYPYPLSDTQFLVAFAPETERREGLFAQGHYGIYLMDVDGRRELLAWDPATSCHQPVPLAARPRPPVRATTVDWRQEAGTYLLQDIYAGPGLRGVPRGTIKRLRVVGLDFRAAGIRSNGNVGPAGGALVSTPVAVGNGSWDVKTVYGDAEVFADGSAWFEAPARVALYFQALDEKGRAVQTMRSWSTLQPGERLSCVGCHEGKGAAPGTKRPQALSQAGPQALTPFYGPPRGFSFIREIQPILDRHCVSCHDDPARPWPGRGSAAFDQERLQRARPLHPADMAWQYTTTRPPLGWETPGFDGTAWATGRPGFGTPGTPGLEAKTLWNTPDIWLRATFEVAGDVAGHELAAMLYHDEDVEVYLNGVLAAAGSGYLVAPKPYPVRSGAALRPGLNHLAVHCHQTIGGQGVAVTLLDLGPAASAAQDPSRAFSLLGRQTPEPNAGRLWSDAYLALTNAFPNDPGGHLYGHSGALVNFLGAQSAPPLLPPYSAGSTQSRLLTMLEEGHKGVKLTTAELEKLACWIDLNIPYCGDYTEANCWNPDEAAKYRHFADKRRRMENLERDNIAEMLGGR